MRIFNCMKPILIQVLTVNTEFQSLQKLCMSLILVELADICEPIKLRLGRITLQKAEN